jgi:hydrogenase maturation protein HypF
MELEALADSRETGNYRFEIDASQEPWQLRTESLFSGIVDDVKAGIPAPRISARFHNGLANLFVELSSKLREETGIARVALSGGVFQNRLLFEKLSAGLREARFEVLSHRQVPANDGGVSLGQAVIAALRE